MSRRKRQLPPVERLRQILRATPYGLYWADDPDPSGFSSDSVYRTWMACRAGKSAGAPGPGGHWIVTIGGVGYLSARIAWAIVHGRDPGVEQVIHLDGDPSNDAPGNLALARPKGKSGMRWVYPTRGGRWRGAMSVDGRSYAVGGTFERPEQAHAAVIGMRRRMGLPV